MSVFSLSSCALSSQVALCCSYFSDIFPPGHPSKKIKEKNGRGSRPWTAGPAIFFFLISQEYWLLNIPALKGKGEVIPVCNRIGQFHIPQAQAG